MPRGDRSPVLSEDNFSEEEGDHIIFPNGDDNHPDGKLEEEELNNAFHAMLKSTNTPAFFKNAYFRGFKWSGSISLVTLVILLLWRAINTSSSDRALDALFSWGPDNKAVEITLLTVFLFVGLCVCCTCYHGHHRSFRLLPSGRALDIKRDENENNDEAPNNAF